MHIPDVPQAASHRWQWHSPAVVRLSRYLYPVWLLGQVVAWFAIAGQAGSPRPDHWDTLEDIAAMVEAGMLAAIVMLLLAPLGKVAARKGRRWAAAFPMVLVVGCAGQVVLALYLWETKPSIG